MKFQNDQKPFSGLEEREQISRSARIIIHSLAGIIVILVMILLLIGAWALVEHKEKQQIIKIYNNLPELEQAVKGYNG